MTLDPLPQIRREFKRLGWSDIAQKTFLLGCFGVDNVGLLFLEERQKLLAVLQTLKTASDDYEII